MRLVYLQSGHVNRFRFREEELRALEGTIAAEAERMGRPASQSNFPAAPSPQKCIACKYATVCDEADLALPRRQPS